MKANTIMADAIRLVNMLNFNFIFIIMMGRLKVGIVVLLLIMLSNIVIFSASQKYLADKFGSSNLATGKKSFFYVSLALTLIILGICIWQKEYIYLIIFCLILGIYFLVMKLLNMRSPTKKRNPASKRKENIRAEKMHEKEKLLLLTAGLFLSGLLFAFLLYPISNHFGIQTRILGSRLMDLLAQKQYEEVYGYFGNDLITSKDEFLHEQISVAETLGDIEEYSFMRQWTYTRDNGRFARVRYNTVFNAYDQKVPLELCFIAEKNGWNLFDISISTDHETAVKINELISIREKRSELDRLGKENLIIAMEYARDAISLYKNGNYGSIYKRFSSELKQRGSMEDLEEYMRYSENIYGKLNSFVLEQYSANADSSEFKLRYKCNFKKLGSHAGILIWIRNEGSPAISGFKFIEGTW